jgi:hypothetical protein
MAGHGGNWCGVARVPQLLGAASLAASERAFAGGWSKPAKGEQKSGNSGAMKRHLSIHPGLCAALRHGAAEPQVDRRPVSGTFCTMLASELLL